MVREMFVLYLPFLNIVTFLILAMIWHSDTWLDGLLKSWFAVLVVLHVAYVWPLLQTMVRF